MKVYPSAIPGLDIHAPDSPEFLTSLSAILGEAPKRLLKPALPYSVILENRSTRTIPFFAVRFDMVSPSGKQYSVVHYADSLRNPEKSDFRAGCRRFMCAEPEYTALLIRGDIAPHTRGRMNLANLSRMTRLEASLDCVAFADGEFRGPDSRDAFDRLARERKLEQDLIHSVLPSESSDSRNLEDLLSEAVQDTLEPATRNISRKLLEGFQIGGVDEATKRAREWRYKIPLWKAHSLSQT